MAENLKKILKNNEGFTLLEVILSMAAIAILSGFILQMFIVAANANIKARNIDIASTQAIEIIEHLKSAKAMGDIEIALAFKDFVYDDRDTIFYKAYNKDWEVILNTYEGFYADMKKDDKTKLPEDYSYLLSLKLEPDDMSKSNTADGLSNYGELINIYAEVTDLKIEDDRNILVSYYTSKYFKR